MTAFRMLNARTGKCYKEMMNDWYRITFSADDLLAAKNLELEGHFQRFFLTAGSPEDATLFKALDPHHTTYYFSPGAARIAAKLVAHHSAIQCPAPAMTDIVFVGGHQPSDPSVPSR